MDIDDLPNSKKTQYTYFLGLRISEKAGRKLEALKAKGKSKPDVARKILEEGLDKIDIPI